MAKQYDIIIIGSGPAGSKVAHQCSKAGKKVVVADYLFGGTCALRGCTPKKAMESVTSLWWETQALQGLGFPKLDASVQWKKLMAHKEHFTALVPANTKEKFQAAGIDVIEEKVAFKDKNTITAAQKEWTADQFVIATGAMPRPLAMEGSKYLLNNEDFFDLPELPKHAVFIGGGYISFELSHILAACGVQVTIISNDEKPLSAFDPKLVTKLILATLDKGIDIRLGFEASRIEQLEDKSYEVTIKRKQTDKTLKLPADCVIHSAGRIPQVQHLNLEAAGVEYDEEKGIEVSKNMQCKGNENIYALGDVIGEFPFTPVATYEADIVAYNLLHKGAKSMNYDNIPVVLFTHPKLASVGKSEQELQEAKIDYETKENDLSSDLIEKGLNAEINGYRIFVDKKNKQILGANVLGVKAEEIINMFALAMRNELTSDQIQDTILAYPTATQAFKYMV
ncbi:MAG: NAD(P)/FAD-dependent oxidoreductase [Bacteroidota bacterium]